MDRGVWKAATDRNTDNCVYNWDGDRKTVKFATTNAVKFRTAHEVINSNETRNLYAEDVEDLRKGYAAAQAGLLELLRKFASL